MALQVALQMDPIEQINLATDTTFMLGLEAQARGHMLYYYTPDRLVLDQGEVFAEITPISLRYEQGNHVTKEPSRYRNLREMDIIFLRQDPPFNMQYITSTYFLERLLPDVRIVNHPASVRNAPEKWLVTAFPELTPPTVITEHKPAITDFYQTHSHIILKPLHGFGGTDIFEIQPNQLGLLDNIMDLLLSHYHAPIVAQRYIPEVRNGDKRVLLLDGDPIGAVLRKPKAHSVRANFHAGGSAHATELSERDKLICRTIAPTLKSQGLLFVGIDIIGDYLTEINVTSPTCLQEINALYNVQLERIVWDYIEKTQP